MLTAELVTVSADPAATGADAALAVGRLLERAGCPLRARRVVHVEEVGVERALRQADRAIAETVEHHAHLRLRPAIAG